ncbi:siderophore-interacting protein [Actinomadura flavalba]|uniref:siderophore-interacting protein n=1 Tax=Actinomadura flavalba TaxID=1120938 RepID=UPI000369C74F|nr:siderophore-interacting protein [Actinomadura flavalba]
MPALPLRTLRVLQTRRVTPRMARITFGGDLHDLVLAGPDQQVKLYFPRPGQAAPVLPDGGDGDLTRWYRAFAAMPEDERPWMRSFTLRGHDATTGTLAIDFVLHGDAGPASRWAGQAEPGDVLAMFGPSAAFARPVPLLDSAVAADWVLLAGDETTLPAIGTLLAALPARTRVLAFLEVADIAEEQRFTTSADVTGRWLHRDGTAPGDPGLLTRAVAAAAFPPGAVFAWLGGAAPTVRALRRHLVGDRGVPKHAVDFTGYWRPRLTQDDAPTPDDHADAAALLEQARALTRTT